MKIEKIVKITAILCAFALLCGCADNPNSSNNSSVQQSTENSSSSSSSASSDTPSVVSDSSAGKSEVPTKEIGNGMILKGTPMDKSELEEFSLDPYMHDYVSALGMGEFFDDLGIPELKGLYNKADSLIQLLTDTCIFDLNSIKKGVASSKDLPFIETTDCHIYQEYGYTYDSFYNTFLEVFTKEEVEKLYGVNNFILNYDGSLFCIWATSIRSQGVHREYEIVSKSDTAVEIKKTIFDYDLDMKPATEYIPELRDQYQIKTETIKFVLTENGWRIASYEGIW